MTEPQYWVATEDPSLDLAAWLDEQVRQAITAYVEEGFFWIDDKDGTVRFHAADALAGVVNARSMSDLLSEWCLDNLPRPGGIITGKERAVLTTFRDTLAAVVAQMDAALAKSAS